MREWEEAARGDTEGKGTCEAGKMKQKAIKKMQLNRERNRTNIDREIRKQTKKIEIQR